MKKFRCKVCGEIINEGATKCPVCGVGPDKWEEIVEGTEKIWATEHKIGEGMECGDEEITKTLFLTFIRQSSFSGKKRVAVYFPAIPINTLKTETIRIYLLF